MVIGRNVRIVIFVFKGSEIELQRQLNLALVANRAGDAAERAEVRDVGGRKTVVHPVEQVERLDAQLGAPVGAQCGSTGTPTG